jgi:hypothetical protein
MFNDEIDRGTIIIAEGAIRLTPAVLHIYEAVYCGLRGIEICHRDLARTLYTGAFFAACHEYYDEYEEYEIFHTANIGKYCAK